MIFVIEMCYLYYWFKTFTPSSLDGKVYRQRLVVTAVMIAFLLGVGHYASKELGAVLVGWAIASELFCFVCNFLDLDERLFGRARR